MASFFSNRRRIGLFAVVVLVLGAGTCALLLARAGSRPSASSENRFSDAVRLAEKIRARTEARARRLSGGGFERVRKIAAKGDERKDPKARALAQSMRADLDAGDWQSAREKARELLASRDSAVQLEVRTVLSWIGERVLPEMIEMAAAHEMEDETSLIDLQCVIRSLPQEDRRAEAIVTTVLCLKQASHIDGVLLELSPLSDEVRLQALSRIIRQADGTVAGECAREMYAHFNGGTEYDSAN